jgi:hypothetical protein
MQAKRKVPRASFSITILDDEDYRLLMSEARGAEHFGAFVAICIVGRQRLLDKRAHQVPGTDALCIDNSIAHVLSMAHVTRKQFDAMVKALAAVSSEAKSQAWLYVDDQNRIVIRSFFKFNTDANWGGPRDGAGRKNQDDSSCNQDDSSAATCFPSVSSSSSISSSSLGLESERERETASPPKQTKPEAKTAPTVVDDDDPVPIDLDGPIGGNTAKQVRETIWTADQLWPAMDNTVRIVARQWLADHPAKRIIAAMNTAKANGIGKPEPYIRSLLADPTFPREATGRRTAPPRPAAPELKPWVPPVLPDSMFDLTPEEEAILARKGKTA